MLSKIPVEKIINMQNNIQPYQTTDIVSKHHIISKSAASDAISLCQTDTSSRKACKQLPVPEKVRICLTNDHDAANCDFIPMFSKQQFLTLIPPEIQISSNSPHLTHDFYAQNYKLASEGFSLALYKARLMNTMCASLRPEILINHAQEFSTLPPYVNVDIIDAIVMDYSKAASDPTSMYENLPEQDRTRITSRFAIQIALYGKKFKPRELIDPNKEYEDPSNIYSNRGFNAFPTRQGQIPVDESERYSDASTITIIYRISESTGELLPAEFFMRLLDDPDPDELEGIIIALQEQQRALDKQFGIDGPMTRRERYAKFSKFGVFNTSNRPPMQVIAPPKIDVKTDYRLNKIREVFDQDKILDPYAHRLTVEMQYSTSITLRIYKEWEAQGVKFPDALIISRLIKMLLDDGKIINASITTGPLFYDQGSMYPSFRAVGDRVPKTYQL